MHELWLGIQALALAITACGIAYLAFALWRVLAFARWRTRSAAHGLTNKLPGISVFKPVCGAEPQLFENLSSFCAQDYPSFQVIFGVRDADDAAIPVIRRVMDAHPNADLTLVIDPRVRGANLKVANLMNMAEHATHELYAIADSDIRADRTYLRSIARAFAEPRVGAATSLFTGAPIPGLFPALGAMFVNDIFSPSVLVAITLQELRFCVGATMAIRKPVLERVGGFETLSAYLADDAAVGELAAAAGYKVALADCVVRTLVADATFSELVTHELRWARTVKTVRPLGYSFYFITYALPWSLIALALTRSTLALVLFGMALILRVAVHYAARRAFDIHDQISPWLIPFRDLLALAIWMTSFFGRRIRWRGRAFHIEGKGLIEARVD